MAAVHRSMGNWSLCGRFTKRFPCTEDDSLVTCKVCIAGGMSQFKLNYKNMSAHNHDDETIKNAKRPTGDMNNLQDVFAENNRKKWDTILTDAIELTEGQIQPYDRILKYLSTHYNINKVG